jgi:hypothetical protein
MGGTLVVDGGRVGAMARAVTASRAAEVGVPGGFRRDANGAGLIVPVEYSRLREVITKDEWKALDRAIRKVLGPRQIRFRLECDHKGCPDPVITRVREADGGFTLRCGHADRVFTPSI